MSEKELSSQEERQEQLKRLIDNNEKRAEERLGICYKCPLYSLRYGGSCNSKLYLNPKTGDVATYPEEGYIRGCNCVLQDKTRYPESKCPAGKW